MVRGLEVERRTEREKIHRWKEKREKEEEEVGGWME